MDLHTLFTIFHLFGVVIGAGGAFASDLVFLQSLKDRQFSATEVKVLKLGSKMVWVGVGVLVISGFLLFSLDPEKYLGSSKFLAKMTIVFFLVLNGVVFHFFHIPRIVKFVGMPLNSKDAFAKSLIPLLISGAISFVSWTSALILGSLRQVPFSYFEIMSAYAIVVVGAVFFIAIAKKHFLSE